MTNGGTISLKIYLFIIEFIFINIFITFYLKKNIGASETKGQTGGAFLEKR